ncbi:hypothetical protein [Sphingomonas sp. S-NIH.Pt15_0812]|uniref:hypothetical protein n=1 Tax=Sphingomonas sp. S-NIH.Pt15_0812 TaxID=1920129 RepID=UPI000F7DEB04|nr:hypothetical protein [Sphingomonas sp. S-NIH.Pt15_0812]
MINVYDGHIIIGSNIGHPRVCSSRGEQNHPLGRLRHGNSMVDVSADRQSGRSVTVADSHADEALIHLAE